MVLASVGTSSTTPQLLSFLAPSPPPASLAQLVKRLDTRVAAALLRLVQDWVPYSTYNLASIRSILLRTPHSKRHPETTMQDRTASRHLCLHLAAAETAAERAVNSHAPSSSPSSPSSSSPASRISASLAAGLEGLEDLEEVPPWTQLQRDYTARVRIPDYPRLFP